MSKYILPTLDESLRDKYIELCLDLEKYDEARNIPETREGLIGRIQELTFEQIHKYHIGQK